MDYEDILSTREYFNDLIEAKNFKELKSEINDINIVDLADVLEGLEDKNMLICFRMLSKENEAEVFSYLDTSDQLRIVNSITDTEVVEIIEDLFFDDMIDILGEMPVDIVTKVIAKADPEKRKIINEFLRFPEDSAASIMTIEFVKLALDMTAKEALDYIKKTAAEQETIYTCFVVNEYNTLMGFVSLRTIVTAKEDTLIKDIMDEDVIFVQTTDDKEKVADLFVRYGYFALPVVDYDHKLFGIITFDDVINVVEEEATEDFHKMVAINPSDEDYLDETPWQLAKNRIPWLLVLMISATFTSTVIGRSNEIVGKYIILTSFIPMITGTGGNTGAQSSTTIIRALATEEVQLSDTLKILFKELEVSVMVGFVLAFVNFLRLSLLAHVNILISFLVALTLFFTVMLSKLLGAGLPLLAKKIHIDPALCASAVITTIIDTLSLVIYFKLSVFILG